MDNNTLQIVCALRCSESDRVTDITPCTRQRTNFGRSLDKGEFRLDSHCKLQLLELSKIQLQLQEECPQRGATEASQKLLGTSCRRPFVSATPVSTPVSPIPSEHPSHDWDGETDQSRGG